MYVCMCVCVWDRIYLVQYINNVYGKHGNQMCVCVCVNWLPNRMEAGMRMGYELKYYFYIFQG